MSGPVDTKSSAEENSTTYLNELEKHYAKIDETASESCEESGRPSRTSTIRAVEDFFKEYRPPSCRLNRLSYLDKALPPPPPDVDSDHDLTDNGYVSESHEFTQTRVAIHNRYSTRSGASTVSVPRRGSNQTLISVRSRYSTQSTDSNRVSEVAPDDDPVRPRRRPSETSEQSRSYSRKQIRGSIPYRGTVLEGVDEEKEAHREREIRKEIEANHFAAPEKDPWLLEQTHGSLESDDITIGIKSKDFGDIGKAPASKNNDFVSFYKQCATSLEQRKATTARRKGSRTSETRRAGLFAGCFWSRDGVADDLA